MTARMLRAPERAAAWSEHERLYLAIVERADRAPSVQRAFDRAAIALDALLDTSLYADDGDPAANVIAFLRSLRALVRAYLAAEPALSEFAYPAGRINRPEVGLLPPQLTYFVAPLASIGIVGQMALGRLLERRIDRDSAVLAKFVLDELRRQAAFTIPALRRPQSLSELRAIAGTPRGRGRPAGRSPRRTPDGWHDVPETLEALVALVRPIVGTMRRNGDTVRVATVAARLGIDERRLRAAFAEHRIRGPALLRALRREIEEDRR